MHRCESNIRFSLKTICLLGAYPAAETKAKDIMVSFLQNRGAVNRLKNSTLIYAFRLHRVVAKMENYVLVNK